MSTDPIQRAIDRVLPDTAQPPPGDRIWARVAVSLGGETDPDVDSGAPARRRAFNRLLMLTTMTLFAAAFAIIGFAIIGQAPLGSGAQPANVQRSAIFTAVERATAVDNRLIDWLRTERAVLWQASEPAVIALDAAIEDVSQKLKSEGKNPGASMLEAQLMRYVSWRSALLLDLTRESAG